MKTPRRKPIEPDKKFAKMLKESKGMTISAADPTAATTDRDKVRAMVRIMWSGYPLMSP